MTAPVKTVEDIIAENTAKQLLGNNYSGASKPDFTIVRANTTPAYTIGQTITGTVSRQYIPVPSYAESVNGLVAGGTLICSSITPSMSVNVFLFSEEITIAADGAVPTTVFADVSSKLVAVIPFTQSYAFGTNNIFVGTAINYQSFLRKGHDTKLYPYFLAGGSFTGSALQNITLLLDTV